MKLSSRTLLLSTTLLTACSGSGDLQSSTTRAKLRAIHLSPGAPAIDLVAMGTGGESRVFTDLAFLSGTPYAHLVPGTYALSAVAAGAPSSSALLTATKDVVGDHAYTLAAFGKPDALRAAILEDTLNDTPPSGLRIRVIHAAAGVGTVGLLSLDPASGKATPLTTLAYSSVTPYLDLGAGPIMIGVDTNGDNIADLTFDLSKVSAGITLNAFVVAKTPTEVSILAESQDGTVLEIQGAPATASTPMNNMNPMMMTPPPPAQQDQSARVRVLHLSPDAPQVDVYANGSARPVIAGLAFAHGTEYLPLVAGRYDFDVAPAGTEISSAVLHIRGIDLAMSTRYTLTALGRVARIQALALEDKPAAADQIAIRAIHAADGVGPVDIYNLPDGATPARVVDGLAFGTASSDLQLPPGAYQIGVDVDRDGQSDVAFKLPDTAAGHRLNVFVTSDAQGTVFAIAQADNGAITRIEARSLAPAKVRVMHLSPDAPSVDVFVDGSTTPAIRGLNFGQGSAYVSVPNGTSSFAVAPSGMPESASVLKADGVELAPSGAYTVCAIAPVQSIRPLLLVDDDSAPPAGMIRVRAIHAASGVGTVDVLALNNGVPPSIVTANLSFGEAGSALHLPAGSFDLGLDTNGDHQPEFSFTIPHLPAGTRANIFASATSNGFVHLIVELDDGSTIRVFPH